MRGHKRSCQKQSYSGRSDLNWSSWIRQVHRWLAIIFTVTVIANFAARAIGDPPMWVTYSPLAPLFLLMFTGLYMFLLPYAARRRARAMGKAQ